MSNEETNKFHFFNRIKTSIVDFDKYQIFANEKFGKAIIYLLLLMIIFSCVVALSFTYQFKQSVDEGVSYIKNNIEDIKYENGILSVNNDNELFINTNFNMIPIVIINTQEDTDKVNEYIDEIGRYDSGIIILKDKIVYKNNLLSGTMEYEYNQIANEYSISNFTKEELLELINGLTTLNLYMGFFIVSAIYMFIIYFTSTIIDALMLALLGFIVARIVSVKIKFKACFNMGIYALTLPIILNLIYIVVNMFTGINIKYFQWMYTTISYIYMILAILLIRTDLINKHMELIKIINEQEKVRKDLEQQKEDKDNDKEEKPEQEDKQKKRDKEPKEDDNIDDNGLAPQQ